MSKLNKNFETWRAKLTISENPGCFDSADRRLPKAKLLKIYESRKR